MFGNQDGHGLEEARRQQMIQHDRTFGDEIARAHKVALADVAEGGDPWIVRIIDRLYPHAR